MTMAPEGLLSPQGVMVLLLVGYATALWLFLRRAPKVCTVMTSDLETARRFLEQDLGLAPAETPLHYYAHYEQALGLTDPLLSLHRPGGMPPAGFWYQLRRRAQVHLIGGAQVKEPGRVHLLCSDRDCLEWLLLRAQIAALPGQIVTEHPLHYRLRSRDGHTIECQEVVRQKSPRPARRR